MKIPDPEGRAADNADVNDKNRKRAKNPKSMKVYSSLRAGGVDEGRDYCL